MKRGRGSWRLAPRRDNPTLEQADQDLLDGDNPTWRSYPPDAIARLLARIKDDIERQIVQGMRTPEERKAQAAKDRRDIYGD